MGKQLNLEAVLGSKDFPVNAQVRVVVTQRWPQLITDETTRQPVRRTGVLRQDGRINNSRMDL